MTCKDCVHYEVCEEVENLPCRGDFKWYRAEKGGCPHSKPKSRFVELPCEFGTVIYMLVTRKTHSFEFFNGKMTRKNNQHTFIKKTKFIHSNALRVLYDFGKTVFLSPEEAKKALAERSKE